MNMISLWSWFTFSLWLLCCEYFHVFIGHLYLFRDMFLPALYLLFNLVVFFIIELLELLCVIYTSLFSDIWFANIFSISKLLFSCQCPLKHNFIQKLNISLIIKYFHTSLNLLKLLKFATKEIYSSDVFINKYVQILKKEILSIFNKLF